jgi:hypothetical protein
MNKSVKNLFMSSKSTANNCLMYRNPNNSNNLNNNSQNFGNRSNNNKNNNNNNVLNEGFCTVRAQINDK